MILSVSKWPVRAEFADDWPAITAELTARTRAEDGNLFIAWSRSLDDPHEWVAIEAFRDPTAVDVHVCSDYFTTATATVSAYLSAAPSIITSTVDTDGWSPMGPSA